MCGRKKHLAEKKRGGGEKKEKKKNTNQQFQKAAVAITLKWGWRFNSDYGPNSSTVIIHYDAVT